jgi:hypothetical protein
VVTRYPKPTRPTHTLLQTELEHTLYSELEHALYFRQTLNTHSTSHRVGMQQVGLELGSEISLAKPNL